MISSYKILFSVDLLHDFYSTSFCKDFSIIPSPATAKYLKANQLLYRQVNHQLLVLTKVNTGASSIVPNPKDKVINKLSATAVLSFYLILNNPQFFTITQAAQLSFATHKFYFNNLTANSFNQVLYLSKPLPAFIRGNAYAVGNIVSQGNSCFQCLADHSNESLNNTTFWVAKNGFQYATNQDSTRVLPKIINYTLSAANAATSFTIKAFALNKMDNTTFDVEQPLKHHLFTSDELTTQVQINLEGLMPGRYRITINGTNIYEENSVYIDDTMYANQVAGVLEIFSHLPAANEYALYTIDDKTKDTPVNNKPNWLKYSIRFPNRQAIWKYIALRKSLADISINPNPMNYDFSSTPFPPPPLPSSDADIFLSNKPIPISESPPAFKLEILGGVNGESPPAPAPDPLQSGMLVQHNNQDYFNIYLNY